MIGVIPAAGLGKRMHPLTLNVPKPLLPVLNKPIIQHVIDRMRSVRIDEIIVVIGYMKEKIMDELKDLKDIEVKFVEQKKIDGTVSAIKLAGKYIDDDFVVMWGDNFFRGRLNDLVHSHLKKRAKISLILDRYSKTGAKAYIKGGKIVGAEERPKARVKNGYSFAGLYAFSHDILDLVDYVEKAESGEYEMSDLLQSAIEMGYDINYVWLEGWRVNVTTPLDLLNVNLKALDERNTSYFIGKNCNISGKIVRSVLCDDVVVEKSLVRDSLIMDGAEIRNSRLGRVIVRGNRIVNGATTTIKNSDVDIL